MENMEDLKDRIGKFRISRELILDRPDIALEIMSKVIVTRCELMFHSDYFEYTAVSPIFDVVPVGFMAHEYSINYNPEIEEVNVHFVRET